MQLYPPVGFHFKVEFDLTGVTDNDSRFRDVTGLSSEVSVTPLPEGGENRFVHQLPTGVDYQPLVLKRGMVTDSGVIQWVRNTLENFVFEPTNVTISLLNQNHEPLRTWQLVNAWPKKWSISDFNAQDNSVVIETLELEYNYFSLINYAGNR